MQIQIDRNPFNAKPEPGPYYVMLVRHEGETEWTVEFGDYDRECVEYDADVYEYDGHMTTILKCEDARQTTVDAAADNYRAKMNRGAR